MDSLELNWLALNLIPKLGVKTLQKLSNSFDSIEAILAASASELVQKAGISESLAKRITKAKEAHSFQIERRLIEESNVDLLCLESPNYPELLKEISAAPPVLYWEGSLKEVEGICIGFVGSRSFTSYGKKHTERLIFELADLSSDVVIISGLARGIDTIAHQAALKAGLKTIAVLAGGLKNIYPPENHALAEEIKSQGALISEFPMGLKPIARNFPIRNRVISGLSHGIVITEAGQKSGALITASFGIQHNREIFALPGRVDSAPSLGTNRLISRNQAKLIIDANDIIEDLQFIKSKIVQTQFNFELTEPQQIDFNELTEAQTKVLKIFSSEVQDLDTIYSQTQISINELLGLLIELELMGYIHAMEGQQYRLDENFKI